MSSDLQLLLEIRISSTFASSKGFTNSELLAMFFHFGHWNGNWFIFLIEASDLKPSIKNNKNMHSKCDSCCLSKSHALLSQVIAPFNMNYQFVLNYDARVKPLIWICIVECIIFPLSTLEYLFFMKLGPQKLGGRKL